MDEIEWIKISKRAIKFITLIILITLFILAFMSILAGGFNNQESTIIIKLMIMIAIYLIVFDLFAFGIIYFIYKIFYIKLDVGSINKEYIRDIPNSSAPAILSLLDNFNVEIYRDYTATILNLYLKKYIDISNFNDEVNFYKTEKCDLLELQKHEIYVYNCILNKEKFNEVEFKKLIYEDAEVLGLINKTGSERIKPILTIMIIAIMFAVCIIGLIKTNNNESFVELMIVIILMIFGIKKIYNFVGNIIAKITFNYVKSSKGKKEQKKAKSLKKYLKEYTLIKEKNIDYVEILEEYIPYALSLGVAKTVENYISNNEIYRKLIYNK